MRLCSTASFTAQCGSLICWQSGNLQCPLKSWISEKYSRTSSDFKSHKPKLLMPGVSMQKLFLSKAMRWVVVVVCEPLSVLFTTVPVGKALPVMREMSCDLPTPDCPEKTEVLFFITFF